MSQSNDPGRMSADGDPAGMGDPPSADYHTHPGSTWHPGWKGHDGHLVHRHDADGTIHWEVRSSDRGRGDWQPEGTMTGRLTSGQPIGVSYGELRERLGDRTRLMVLPHQPAEAREYCTPRVSGDTRGELLSKAIDEAAEFFGTKLGLAIEPGWEARRRIDDGVWWSAITVSRRVPQPPPFPSLAADARAALEFDDGTAPFVDRHTALRRFAQHVAESEGSRG